MTKEEIKEEVEEEEEVEGEEEQEKSDEELDKALNAKVERIINAIKESPVRKQSIAGVEASDEKSVMELDPFARRTRPFVKLSGKMKDFVEGVRELAKTGTITHTKALQESDDTAGGFLVPEEFQAEVIRFATEAAIVRPRARVFPMRSNTLTLPKLDQSNYRFAGIDIHWEGDEGDEKEESQPKFGRITLKLGKMIGLCPVSDDLLADSAVNLANFLVAIFGEAIAYEEDKQFLIGDGMKKPLGILNCGVQPDIQDGREADGKITYEDLKKMREKLPAWADAGAIWLTTKAGLTEILDIKSGVWDGTNIDETKGMPLFLPGFSLAADLPKTILGYPYAVTDKLPAVGSKGDIMLANLAAYYIGDKGGLAVASSIHDRFRYDETTFRFVKRVDGQCALSNAFVVLDEYSAL
jgi:HK97 family phage major capsid protein